MKFILSSETEERADGFITSHTKYRRFTFG